MMPQDCHDLTKLVYIHAPAVLHMLKQRWRGWLHCWTNGSACSYREVSVFRANNSRVASSGQIRNSIWIFSSMHPRSGYIDENNRWLTLCLMLREVCRMFPFFPSVICSSSPKHKGTWRTRYTPTSPSPPNFTRTSSIFSGNC